MAIEKITKGAGAFLQSAQSAALEGVIKGQDLLNADIFKQKEDAQIDTAVLGIIEKLENPTTEQIEDHIDFSPELLKPALDRLLDEKFVTVGSDAQGNKFCQLTPVGARAARYSKMSKF